MKKVIITLILSSGLLLLSGTEVDNMPRINELMDKLHQDMGSKWEVESE